jgi:hypothetical protein
MGLAVGAVERAGSRAGPKGFLLFCLFPKAFPFYLFSFTN